MDLITRLNEFIDLIEKENNEHLYNEVVELQKDILKLIEENQSLQKKVDAKEGCYWENNSDGG